MGSRHLKLLPSSVSGQPDSSTDGRGVSFSQVSPTPPTAGGASGPGVSECGDCGYSPCACGYIVRISSDGPLWELGAIAVEQMEKPFPHRGACPCPSCYSDRARTWEVEA